MSLWIGVVELAGNSLMCHYILQTLMFSFHLSTANDLDPVSGAETTSGPGAEDSDSLGQTNKTTTSKTSSATGPPPPKKKQRKKKKKKKETKKKRDKKKKKKNK